VQSSTATSKQKLIKDLVRHVREISSDDVNKFVSHVRDFLTLAKKKTPIFTQSLCETSHLGDEFRMPLFSEDVEKLLDKYCINHTRNSQLSI